MDKSANKDYTDYSNFGLSSAKLEYELTTIQVDDSEYLSYTAYGISVQDEDGNRLVEYPDISTSRDYVKRFIDMLETRDVAAIHIGDMLEDYLV